MLSVGREGVVGGGERGGDRDLRDGLAGQFGCGFIFELGGVVGGDDVSVCSSEWINLAGAMRLWEMGVRTRLDYPRKDHYSDAQTLDDG